jgi:hypothetical protein
MDENIFDELQLIACVLKVFVINPNDCVILGYHPALA